MEAKFYLPCAFVEKGKKRLINTAIDTKSWSNPSLWIEFDSIWDLIFIRATLFQAGSDYILREYTSKEKKVKDLAVSSLQKKWSFPLRISSVNVTKSVGNCGFGHIYWRNP